MRGLRFCCAISSSKVRRMRNGRPASETSTSSLLSSSAMRSPNSPTTCAGSRGAAEAVPDQDRGCHKRRPQMIGGGDQIVDIGGERGVGELALAGAEPGEI